nr:hypothetical protein [Streptomyces sp. KL118A]
MPGDDQWGDGVPEGRQHDLREGPGVAARQVGHREDGDARQTEAEAGEAACAEAFRVAEEAGEEGADDRDGGDEEPGGGAGDAAFGVGQGPPRAEDLHAGEGQHGTPVRPEHAGEPALPHGEREQERRAEGTAREDHHRRRQTIVDRHFDHEVGDAPQGTHE